MKQLLKIIPILYVIALLQLVFPCFANQQSMIQAIVSGVHTCSETPFFSYTTLDSYTLIGQDHYSNAYGGIQYEGDNTSLCQVDFYTAITGDISAISWIVSIYSLDESNNLDTLRGTSSTVAGSGITNGGWSSFNFESPVTLNTGDVVVISRSDDPQNESASNCLRMNYTYNANDTLNIAIFDASGASQVLLDRAVAVRLYTNE
jgi:hypothetical protein